MGGMGCHAHSQCNSKQSCECGNGYCADGLGCDVNPKTTCRSCKKAVGTCGFFGCHESRGPTNCVDGKCICALDTCSLDQSLAILSGGLIFDGKCVDAVELPTKEYDVIAATSLSQDRSIPAKRTNLAIGCIVVLVFVGGIYARIHKQNTRRDEYLLLA